MAKRDIVVVGASAGGVEALSDLVAHLPDKFAAALFIAWHSAPFSHSFLPEILQRHARLPVAHAEDGEPVRQGKVYVAPPDHHMLLENQHVRLTRGPKENRFRPAVDPLFRSAAYNYGPRVIGIVLTGALNDGTAGLWAIKDRGGKAIVQDPTEARHPSMPLSALQHVEVDHKLAVVAIGSKLVELVAETTPDAAQFPISKELEIETRIAQEGKGLEAGALKLGALSPFTCPECHGTLLQIKDGRLVRFRCHTGHAYSVDTLLASLAETGEDALWNAVRAAEEAVILLVHMCEHAHAAGKIDLAASLQADVTAAKKRAETIRRVAVGYGSLNRDLESDQAQLAGRSTAAR